MSAKAATKQSAKRPTQSRPSSKAQTKKTVGPSVPVLVPEVHVRHLQVPQLHHVPVPHVHVPTTFASFVIEDGKPGAIRA